MKTYKINGKEIEKLEPSRFIGSGMAIQKVAKQLDQLLEALSDKEEVFDDFCQWENCSGGKYCPKHSLEHEPKQEKCKNECDECDGSGFMIDHDGDYNTPCDSNKHKKSTSLKDTIQDLLLDYKHTQYNGKPKYLTCGEAGDKLISLIQSHLLKEIERLEYSPESLVSNDTRRGHDVCRTEILDLINNLTK